MKKFLILLLIIFPIFIFAIINFSASIVSFSIPLSTESVEVSTDGINFYENVKVELNNLDKNEISFRYRILPAKTRNPKVSVYSSNEQIAKVIKNIPNKDKKKQNEGLFTAEIKNYGFTQITILTEEGHHKANIQLAIKNEILSSKSVQGVAFEYDKNSSANFKFGNKNKLEVLFSYFPSALNLDYFQANTNFDYYISEYAKVIEAKNGIGIIEIDLPEYNLVHRDKPYELKFGRDEAFETKEKAKFNSSFNFNIEAGINIKNPYIENNKFNQKGFQISHEQISRWLQSGQKCFLLNDLKPDTQLIMNNNTYLYGNKFAIEQSLVEEKDGLIIENFATVDNLIIKGKLSNQQKTHEFKPKADFNNLKIKTTDDSKTNISIINSQIENGANNIYIETKSFKTVNPAVINIKNCNFYGALIASINISARQEKGYKVQSNEVNLQDLSFYYAMSALFVDNSADIKGWSQINILNRLEKSTFSIDGKYNFNNIETADTLFQLINSFSSINKILKANPNAFYQDADDFYYASTLIIMRGGIANLSKVSIEDINLSNNIEIIYYKPSSIEATNSFIGGTEKFTIYMLNKNNRKEK